MPVAGAGDYSADGTKMVYSPRFRDFRPEKRYGGGQANDLWIFDLKTNDAKRIIAGPRADRDPMWIGNTIYFTSDSDGTFNIYAYRRRERQDRPRSRRTRSGTSAGRAPTAPAGSSTS